MAKARQTAVQREGTRVANLTPAQYAAEKLGEVRADLQLCRDENKMTALAALHRLDVDMKDRHTAALAAEQISLEGKPDDLLLSSIVDNAVNLPPVLRDSIMETLEALDTGAIVPLKQTG